MTYNYVVMPRAARKIRTFYVNVAKKYKHTYTFDDMMRNVHDAVFSIYGIEKTLARRIPTIGKWRGLLMANTDKWYFAYKIERDTIVVVDACHAQNMYENVR